MQPATPRPPPPPPNPAPSPTPSPTSTGTSTRAPAAAPCSQPPQPTRNTRPATSGAPYERGPMSETRNQDRQQGAAAAGGGLRTRLIDVATGSTEKVHDLTGACEAFLHEVAAGADGLLNVFVPHATAGVAILETGSGSDDDLLDLLSDLLPPDRRWRHRHGSPGHGRDHVL